MKREVTNVHQVTQDKLNQELEQIISSMTVEEKVAQLFVVVPEALASNAQTTTTAAFGSALAKYPVGGIIYMSANIQNPSQITEAVSKASQYAESACKLPLLLSLDEEGGSPVSAITQTLMSQKLSPCGRSGIRVTQLRLM